MNPMERGTREEEKAIERQVMLALDFVRGQEALSFLDKIKGFHPYLKLGMQLFYKEGPSFVYSLKEKGFPLFLDVKLHDIPNTVKGAARSIASLGVDLFNVHCAGGVKMMEAAGEGIAAAQVSRPPQVIGVTHLTSTSQEMLNQEIGISGSIEAAILRYASLAQQSGLAGVVCSPLEVQEIKRVCGSSFLTVTPGIRLANGVNHDQHRVTTPGEAAQLGTDYMVIGRAITEAADPAAALQDVLDEIKAHTAKG